MARAPRGPGARTDSVWVVIGWCDFRERSSGGRRATAEGTPLFRRARRAAGYGLPARLPAPYPLEDLARANRVALVGMREGWGRDYVVETYRIWFQEGQPAGSEPNLGRSLHRIGQDPERVTGLADAPESKRALAQETEAAKAAGIFGSPSFVVGAEVFWGDDRLEDAIAWHRHGRLG